MRMLKRIKKGFTLLELLAVIVILAIIALIVTPFVTKAIEEAKKGSAEDSAYGIVNAAEGYFGTELSKNNGDFTDTKFTYQNQIVTKEPAVVSDIKYKGTIPKSGIVEINKLGEVEVIDLEFDNYICNGGSKEKITCLTKTQRVNEVKSIANEIIETATTYYETESVKANFVTTTFTYVEKEVTKDPEIAADLILEETPRNGEIKINTVGKVELTSLEIGTYKVNGASDKEIRVEKEDEESGNQPLVNLDNSGANLPKLVTGMIPVYYDEIEQVWKKADKDNAISDYKWYDYNDKMWANAVLVTEENGSRTDLTDSDLGTEIPMNRIIVMMVWIPRFKVNTEDFSTIQKNGINAYYKIPGEIDIELVDSNTEAADAFTFGQQNLSGLWVGKFEISSGLQCVPTYPSSLGSYCNINTVKPKTIPNVLSWAGATVSTYFTTIQSMQYDNETYGFNKEVDLTFDTHMIKNSEWGAIAYFTNSKYGRYIDENSCISSGCEVWINPVSISSTTITGCSGTKVDDSMQKDMTTCTIGYEYNGNENNGNSSTTGNIYGIYDMSGGNNEYTMGNYNYYSGYSLTHNSGFNGLNGDNSNTSNKVPFPDDKYVDIYSGSTYTGHALNETKYWNGDNFSSFVSKSSPWFYRGGSSSGTKGAGIFSTGATFGTSGSFSSRVVATVN